VRRLSVAPRSSPPARRALATLLLVAAGWAGWTTIDQSVRVWVYGHRYRHESHAAAQDRLFGRDYMEAIRSIRSRVGVDEPVYLIDDQRVESGAPYFVAHYLAPRRVELLGTTRGRSVLRVAQRAPSPEAWVVVVGDVGEPPYAMRKAALTRWARRAR
jgi:hypothetical protein